VKFDEEAKQVSIVEEPESAEREKIPVDPLWMIKQIGRNIRDAVHEELTKTGASERLGFSCDISLKEG
jgi:hypothetical protein